MIARLTGLLAHKAPATILIDVSGVGYELSISQTTFHHLPGAGETVSVEVYTHVREDQLVLFGFWNHLEKSLFQKLITVSGIGPKLALAILSGLNPTEVVNAVTGEDVNRLCAIPGVGKKTAERILIDLKDKLRRELSANGGTPPIAPDGHRRLYDDAVSALLNLGYARPAAERMLIDVNMSAHASLATIIREALKMATKS